MPNIRDFQNDPRFADGVRLVVSGAVLFADWNVARYYTGVDKHTYESATVIDIYAHKLFGRMWTDHWCDTVFVRRSDGEILFPQLTNFDMSDGHYMVYGTGNNI